jgi:hypothetical membrane protein
MKRRIGAASGILSPIIGFTCIIASITTYPSFSWTNNALSDLGVVLGVTGPLFNIGLFISGFLAYAFALFGLYSFLGKSWLSKLGSVVFALATVALMAIAVFNEHYSPTHYYASVTFFVLAPISLFIFTCAFWFEQQRRMATFTVLVGAAAALPWLLQFSFNYVPNVAIPEFVSGLAVSAWTIVLSTKMLKPMRQNVTS